LNYAIVYVDEKLDECIKNNITNKKIYLDKYKGVTAYPV
jgi:hypothetical protein